MKEAIHPKYVKTQIVCACGNMIDTRSTRGDFHVEICAACHPFFTGKQKIMDTAGRIEKFKNRYGESPVTDPAATKKAEAKAEAPAPLSKKAAAAAENRAAKRAKANAGKPKPEPKAEVAAEAPAAEAKPE